MSNLQKALNQYKRAIKLEQALYTTANIYGLHRLFFRGDLQSYINVQAQNLKEIRSNE